MQPSQPRQRRAARNPQHQDVRRPLYPDDAPRSAYPDYPRQYAAPAQGAQPQGQTAYPEYPRQYAVQDTRQGAEAAQPGQAAYPVYPQQYAANAYQRPQEAYTGGGYAGRAGQGGTPPRTPYVMGNYTPDAEPVRRQRSREGLWLLIIIGCIALLVLGGFSVSSLYNKRYPAFRQNVQALSQNTFMTGVHIDGVHIGGMTMEQARAALQASSAAVDQQYAFSVTIDGKTWRITQNELPLSRNIEATLQEAWSIGRQGSLSSLQNGITPFAYRNQVRQSVGKSGAFLYTQVTYDKATLHQLAETLSSRVSIPARDATVSNFDFGTRSFQFQAEQVGMSLSSDDIYNAITAQMDLRNYNGGVSLQTSTQQPSVTRAQLQQSFGLISTYTTTTLPDSNRNKNIELACTAVNGTVVASGDSFSFNETTGRRTVEKGYLLAGAIAQGRSYEETGGGVCQVSTTLFNAAVEANMKILKSSPHAWPSAYVEPGRDATVDWQGFQSLNESLDFKFQNTSNYPVFIVAYITGTNFRQACRCTVELYGVSLDEGVLIRLETALTKEVPMPSPQPPEIVAADETHPAGTSEVIVKGRNGYTYDTYRVYYRNGIEFAREKIRTSNYKPYAEQMRYYTE